MRGETISHYKVLEQLGQGSMGQVWLAEDLRLGRKVALKFLAPELVRDHEFLARFRNEARAIAEVSHPNVATLYDVGERDGTPFLVMEHLDGETLQERVRRGPLTVEDALRIGQAAAAGLAKAHSLGVVHRDIKSANIMLVEGGEPKILDFGLAVRHDATQITRPGTAPGTIAYMSPEQARGRSADARSDIWSLGVVLYECLTGRLPFIGESVSVLERIKVEDPTPPTALRTGIPLELEHVVLRCLQRDPDLRYQRAEDLSSNLKLLASTASSSAPMAGSGAHSRAPRKVLQWGVPLLLALLLGSTAWWMLHSRGQPLGNSSPPVLAVSDFVSEGDDPESGATFGLLVHMGLLQSDEGIWVLDPQWLEHQKAKLVRMNSAEPPSAIDVAMAARASYVLHGRLVTQDGVDRAECMLLDVRSGRTLAAWSESATSTRSLASLVADRTLQALVPSTATDIGDADEMLATNDRDAWQAYVQARRLRSENRSDDYRKGLEYAVELDSTFSLAAYEYAMQSERQWPGSTTREMAALAWRHRSRLDLQRRLLLEAKRLEFEGRLHESANILREVNSRWPEDEDTAKQLVSYLWYWQHLPEMNRVLERTLDFFPESVDLRRYRAFGLGFAGYLDRAQREFAYVLAHEVEKRETDSDPELNTLNSMIELALVRGADDEAETLLARDDAKGAWISIRRAELLFCRGQLPEAVQLLRSLGADDPSHPDFGAFMFRGVDGFARLLCESGRTREYRALADSLYQMGGLPAYSWVVDTLHRFGRDDLIGAAVSLEGLRKESRRRFPPIIARACELEAATKFALIGGRLEAARDSVEALTRYVREPGVPGGWIGRVQRYRAQVALAEGDGPRALEELRLLDGRGRVVSLWSDVDFRSLHAKALEATGNLEAAADELEHLLERYRGRALSNLELARVQRKLGRLDSSRKNYDRFFDQWRAAEPDDPTLLSAREEYQGLMDAAQ